jgi:hypothetical protein
MSFRSRRQSASCTGIPRLSLLVSSAIRIAYGASSMFAPEAMAKSKFAPSTGDHPDPRLLLRGFGGHQLMVAAFSLAALRSVPLVRPALALNLMIDGFDAASAVLEIRPRGGADSVVAGGIVLSGAGLAASSLGLLSSSTHQP